MRISNELLDYLGDLYQKYPFKMTFIEFVERVMARMEQRHAKYASGNSKNDNGARVDNGLSPYDPMRKRVRP